MLMVDAVTSFPVTVIHSSHSAGETTLLLSLIQAAAHLWLLGATMIKMLYILIRQLLMEGL